MVTPQAPAPAAAPGPRPAGDGDLHWRRRGPVRWFHPKVLLETGVRVGVSTAMGDFLDKRELQQAAPAHVVDHRHLDDGRERTEAWVDFLADTADGFHATYTMAWLTAQRELVVDGVDRPLPRGSLLVLGGDEVYPSGTPAEYDDRFRGPFKAALPYSPPGDEPCLLAIPGNHDWYDGLTNFMRIFCSSSIDRPRWVGGRRTEQTRSYFAVELPHGWWLWGIDIQLDSFIDQPQLEYFRSVAERMRGGRLILCTGKPSWTDVGDDSGAFRNLAYLEDRVIRPAGATLALTISGDSHHYAHYAADDGTHKLTSGGGGAFLHPTHHLDDVLEVPVDAERTGTVPYRLGCRYPDPRRSRLASLGALLLPLHNPHFLLVPAVAYLLLGWTSHVTTLGLQPGRPPAHRWAQATGFLDVLHGLVRSQIAVLPLVVVLAALIGFAKPPVGWGRGVPKVAAKVVLGSVHLLGQLVAGAGATLLAVDLASLVAGSGWPFVALLAASLAATGAVVASLVFGLYLAVCAGLLRAHGNEAFSAMAHTGYKGFLRLHVDERGALTVYPIGVPKACRSWRYRPDDADPGAPWIAPEQPPDVVLIEGPIEVSAPGR